MSLTHQKLRQLFRQFWEDHGHKEIPPIPLVPKDDPTTLFTGSGMQQLVPYLLGEPHPLGRKLYNIQPCFRSQDIDEIGDNRHTTFFEMMGNWSLGDYFKKDQLTWFFKFLVDKVGLPPKKLFVTVFKGDGKIVADQESIEILKTVFNRYGITAELNKRIFMYPAEKNWWSRAGEPKNMPVGEPGGPDSEVFYDFGEELHLHEHSIFKNKLCHPNCDCGRFLEIGNSVFMQYKKVSEEAFEELPKKNVDFGGGLERIMAASNNNPDIFSSSIYQGIISEIEKETGKDYQNVENQPKMRVIADHIKGAVFLIVNGVYPSNKEQGYFLRRLLRRSIVKMHQLTGSFEHNFNSIVSGVLKTYDGFQGISYKDHETLVTNIISQEIAKFSKSLELGLKEMKKIDKIDGKLAFDLYQNFGFPLEITEELFREKGQMINKDQFKTEFNKHKDLSRSASVGKFKGGLADHGEKTLKYHTATHLFHQALFDVLGQEVRQEGSNITAERLRFDFYTTKNPSKEDINKVEEIVKEKIKESLPVDFKIIPKVEALKIGAKSFFREKYPDMVKVYFIGNYSKEFCGGPHVKNTKEIGKITVYKFERIGSNLYRIYAK